MFKIITKTCVALLFLAIFSNQAFTDNRSIFKGDWLISGFDAKSFIKQNFFDKPMNVETKTLEKIKIFDAEYDTVASVRTLVEYNDFDSVAVTIMQLSVMGDWYEYMKNEYTYNDNRKPIRNDIYYTLMGEPILLGVIDITYNSNGLQDSVLLRINVEGEMTNNILRIMHYDESLLPNTNKIYEWKDESWSFSGEEQYTYNAEGKLSLIMYMQNNEGTLSAMQKTSYEYQENLIISLTSIYDYGEWFFDERIENRLNENGIVETILHQNYKAGTWRNEYIVINFINDAGKVNSFINYTYYFLDWNYTTYKNYEYYDDGNLKYEIQGWNLNNAEIPFARTFFEDYVGDKPLTEYRERFVDNTWTPRYKSENQYSPEMNLEEKTIFIYENDWLPLYKQTNLFTPEGKNYKTKMHYWDDSFEPGDWVTFAYYENEFDIRNNMIWQTYIFNIDGGSEMPIDTVKNEFKYNDRDLLSEKYFWKRVNAPDGEWIWKSSYRDIYIYNSSDNLEELVMQEFRFNEWVNTVRNSYSYDSENNLENDTSFFWGDGDEWSESSLTQYLYAKETKFQNDYTNNLFNLAVYPNPSSFVSAVLLDMPKSGNVSVELVNSRGISVVQLVEGFLNAGSHKFNLSTYALPPGVYNLTVSVNGRYQTMKVAIVR